MRGRISLELVVGLFMLAGLGALGWLAIRAGDVGPAGAGRYALQARFGSVSGLREGAWVELAGVRVGQVDSIRVDPQTYEAVVGIVLDREVRIPRDATASVRTAGIIGDKFLKLSPGGAEVMLEEGAEIIETESSINLEELISKYIFDK